jgi:zinc transport system ATP-binding protein
MLGLVPTVRGQVLLFGSPLDGFRDWRRVGYVPQRVTAAAGAPASVWEVVSAGRLSRLRPWQRMGRADRAAVGSALEAVGLADRRRRGVATLSGGQQQRVLIARALAGEPDLLVLDEPTAGVDVAHQEGFARLVDRLVETGTTVVLVAHELGPLQRLVGRTVVMRDGRVTYDGSPLASYEDVPTPHHAQTAAAPGLGLDLDPHAPDRQSLPPAAITHRPEAR